MNAEQLLVGLIITLVLGGYGYTFILGRDLRKEIHTVWVRLTNHYEHRMLEVEERLTKLETPRVRDE